MAVYGCAWLCHVVGLARACLKLAYATMCHTNTGGPAPLSMWDAAAQLCAVANPQGAYALLPESSAVLWSTACSLQICVCMCTSPARAPLPTRLSGMFVPSLAVGAAGGRLAGRLVAYIVAAAGSKLPVSLAAYSVIGGWQVLLLLLFHANALRAYGR